MKKIALYFGFALLCYSSFLFLNTNSTVIEDLDKNYVYLTEGLLVLFSVLFLVAAVSSVLALRFEKESAEEKLDNTEKVVEDWNRNISDFFISTMKNRESFEQLITDRLGEFLEKQSGFLTGLKTTIEISNENIKESVSDYSRKVSAGITRLTEISEKQNNDLTFTLAQTHQAILNSGKDNVEKISSTVGDGIAKMNIVVDENLGKISGTVVKGSELVASEYAKLSGITGSVFDELKELMQNILSSQESLLAALDEKHKELERINKDDIEALKELLIIGD